MLGFLGMGRENKASTRNNTPLRVVSVQNKMLENRTTRGVTHCVIRWPHVIGTDAKDLVLCFNNWYMKYTGESLTGNPLTIVAVSLEGPGGVMAPVTFNGSRSITLADGDNNILSDAVSASSFTGGVNRGNIFYIKAVIELSSAAHYCPYAGASTNVGVHGALVGWYNPANTTPSSVDAAGQWTATGTTFDSRTNGYYPFLLGHPKTDGPSYIGLGSSSTAGTGDSGASTSFLYGLGYLQRAMHDASGYTNPLPCINFALGGAMTTLYSSVSRWKAFLPYARTAIDQIGLNDIGTTTLETIQTRIESIWASLRTGGIENIIRMTVPPRTSSTDNWATTANQTITSGWDSGQDAALLTAWFQTKLTSQTVDALLDVPSLRDTGNPFKWAVNGTANYMTTDGTHMSPTGHELAAVALRNVMASL